MPANTMWMDDIAARLKRAEEHFDAFQREVNAWNHTRPYGIEKQVNSDFTRYSVIARIKGIPPTQRWSLIVSDCLSSLRSALDYLVYAIAIQESGMNPPPDEGKLQFLIADNLERFEKSAWHIQSLTEETRRLIESVQPYHRPYPGLPPLLAILRDFNDSDKHRLLHVMVTSTAQGAFRDIRNVPDGTSIQIEATPFDVVDKTEIAALVFETPTPDVKYQFIADFVIAMTHTPSPDSAGFTDVSTILVRLIPEVRTVIDTVSVGFMTRKS